MKKLIMFAFVAVATVCANAASVNWLAQKGYLYEAGTTTKITSGDAYLMFVTTSYTQSDLVNAFNAAGGDVAATIAAMTASGAMATGAGVVGSNARIEGASTYAISSDMTAYYVVFNGGNMYISNTADALYDTVTGEASATFMTSMSNSTKAPAMDASAGYTAAGWYTAVPEPTSGLLMLVGLAGLALRRRRA